MSDIKFDITERAISFGIDYFTPGIVYYFADDGISQPTHPRVSSPAGLYHDNKTYIAWQTLDPYIIYFDHTTNTWSDPVKIGTNPLSGDDHGPPQILRDSSGYFHAFYGAHLTSIKYSKTTNPDDITVWNDQPDILAMATYCKVFEDSSGYLWIVQRHGSTTDGDAHIYRSIDGGDTWASCGAFIDLGAGKSSGYGAIEYEEGTPDRVHYAWCMFDTPDRLNIYHCYYTLVAPRHVYSMDGTDLGIQIDEIEANANCKVFDSGVGNVNQPVVHVYSGIPYIIFQHDDGGWKHKFTKWNGLSWDAPVTITTTDNQFNSCDFIVHSATNIEAYLVTGGGAGRGGDIERWDWDGVTWSKVKTILAEGGDWKALGNPQIVKDYSQKIKLIFAEQKAENFTTQLKIFAYGKVGFVENE